MQWPVISLACWLLRSNRKGVLLSDDHVDYRTLSIHNAACTFTWKLKFESYNLQSKNLAHKGVDFYVQNALKLAYTSIFISQKFSGSHTRTSVKGEMGEDGNKKEWSGEDGREREGLRHGCWGMHGLRAVTHCRCWQYAGHHFAVLPRLWNEIPKEWTSPTDESLPVPVISSYSCQFIIIIIVTTFTMRHSFNSVFHFTLKTYLFHKSFPI